MTLAKYSGTDNQLWMLSADGLQGFAGYCFDDNTGNIKAGDIGGLFGEIVEVSTFADLKKYATADIPYTIVVHGKYSVLPHLQKDSSRTQLLSGPAEFMFTATKRSSAVTRHILCIMYSSVHLPITEPETI